MDRRPRRLARAVMSATPFAHASEAEMSRILDFYEVRWEYEPHTFPILWNLDGDVVESFSPDFYLPDLDLYLEMTTLRQKLVRKKNRKLRRLRELYPDIRIKLFYARDFRMLLAKFGRLALADDLTGSSGQVGRPDRSAGIDGRDSVVDVGRARVEAVAATEHGAVGVAAGSGATEAVRAGEQGDLGGRSSRRRRSQARTPAAT